MSPHTIAEQFEAVLSSTPQARFLWWDSSWLTVQETAHCASVMAARLAAAGAHTGDRVVIAMRNSPMFRIVEQGVLCVGYVRVALTPRLHAREIAAIAADCTAAVVCCDAERAVELRTALLDAGCDATVVGLDDADVRSLLDTDERAIPWSAPLPDDIAVLLYSSGTTGRPKGATVTNSAWVAQTSLALAQLLPNHPEQVGQSIGAGDIVIAAAPMAHFGGSMALDAAAVGAATVTLAAFSPRETLESVVAHRATVLPLAPIMLARLAELTEEDPGLVRAAASTLRAIPYGGSPIDWRVLLAASRAFPGLLCQHYGLSETLAPVAALTAREHDAAVVAVDKGDNGAAVMLLSSAGRIAGEAQVRLRQGERDVTDEATSTNPGELDVRGPLVSRGYWNNPAVTYESFDADGWFRTADLAWFDAERRLHLAGRAADLIVSGGFNVRSREVEDAIRTVPEVSDVAVVGLPDPIWGERVHAAITLRRPLPMDTLAAAVEAACRTCLAAYKRPRSIEVMKDLPKTALEKIDRKAIRQARLTD
jgi:acyl-CoA synthetase (AMP-forming)/AMP-acid ligase II